MESWDHHGVTECFGLEGTSKIQFRTFHWNSLLQAPSNPAMEAGTSAVGLPRGGQGLN